MKTTIYSWRKLRNLGSFIDNNELRDLQRHLRRCNRLRMPNLDYKPIKLKNFVETKGKHIYLVKDPSNYFYELRENLLVHLELDNQHSFYKHMDIVVNRIIKRMTIGGKLKKCF